MNDEDGDDEYEDKDDNNAEDGEDDEDGGRRRRRRRRKSCPAPTSPRSRPPRPARRRHRVARAMVTVSIGCDGGTMIVAVHHDADDVRRIHTIECVGEPSKALVEASDA